MNRYTTLDGWRGISILLVLAGHLLPLGPNSWQMNKTIAGSGMVLFFILSGFLITSMLLYNQNIKHFLIRRFARIIPLAWLAILITLHAISADWSSFSAHLFFYGNWPPQLTEYTSHFWSLCVEMQFYIAVAVLVALFNKRGLWLLPLLCVAVTVYRYMNGAEMAINTYYRVDEILAGCILALFYTMNSDRVKSFFTHLNPLYFLPLLILSAHPEAGVFNYFRPYIAMLLIGSTLFGNIPAWLGRVLDNKLLIYIAAISFALYVIHGILVHTWLGVGDTTLEKYLKRPLLFALIFGLAHISTFYYERFFIRLGKKATSTKKDDQGSMVLQTEKSRND